MNERIKELAKQSYERRKRVIPNLPIGEPWIEFDAEGRPTNLPDELVFNKEKFAELIVRDCMSICKQHPSRIVSNNWDADAVAPDIVHRFEEHFGVEE